MTLSITDTFIDNINISPRLVDNHYAYLENPYFVSTEVW
jgi:hypothetical protein